jgi:hypothetical protein
VLIAARGDSSVAWVEDGTILNADWDNNRIQGWDGNGTFL